MNGQKTSNIESLIEQHIKVQIACRVPSLSYWPFKTLSYYIYLFSAIILVFFSNPPP